MPEILPIESHGTARAIAAAEAFDVAQEAAGRRRIREAVAAPARKASRRRARERRREEVEAMPYGLEKMGGREALEKAAEYGRRAAETSRREKALVRQRLQDGFVLERPARIAGIDFEPFVEEGLRSRDWGVAGKLFLRALPRKGKLRTGRDKAIMIEQWRSKLLSCDEPYIEGNRSMVSLIRVDLDASFKDIEELRSLLQALVDSGDLPCMPHLVAGGEEDVALDLADIEAVIVQGLRRQRLVKPHLWWILPDAVTCTSKGKRKPIALLDAVYRGLVDVLVPLGADPKARWRLVRGKNPMSPFWTAGCFNEAVFPSLSEYAAVLGDRMRKSVEDLTRDAAAAATEDRTLSNAFYDAACKLTWSLLKDWHAEADGAYRKALEETPEKGLLPLLRSHLTVSDVDASDGTVALPERAERVLDLVAGYAARAWSPEKADEVAAKARRGTLSHLTAGVESLSERQAIAARATTEGKVQKTRTLILKTMESVEHSGAPFTQAEVARASGLNRKTVSAHWRFCLGRRPFHSLDKKVPLIRASVSTPKGPAVSPKVPPRPILLTVRVSESDRTVSPVTARAVPAVLRRGEPTPVPESRTSESGNADQGVSTSGRKGVSSASDNPGVPPCPRPPERLFWRGGKPKDEGTRAVIRARVDAVVARVPAVRRNGSP